MFISCSFITSYHAHIYIYILYICIYIYICTYPHDILSAPIIPSLSPAPLPPHQAAPLSGARAWAAGLARPFCDEKRLRMVVIYQEFRGEW